MKLLLYITSVDIIYESFKTKWTNAIKERNWKHLDECALYNVLLVFVLLVSCKRN